MGVSSSSTKHTRKAEETGSDAVGSRGSGRHKNIPEHPHRLETEFPNLAGSGSPSHRFVSGLMSGLCQEDAQASCCTKDEGGPFGAVL
jgi:hypothetical protein